MLGVHGLKGYPRNPQTAVVENPASPNAEIGARFEAARPFRLKKIYRL
jgi:hypothetical protein